MKKKSSSNRLTQRGGHKLRKQSSSQEHIGTGPREEARRLQRKAADVASLEPFDIAVLTVIPIELQAMREALGVGDTPVKLAGGTNVWCGRFESERDGVAKSVALVCAGEPGNTACAALASEMIHKFQPRFILLVGIAAGIRSRVQIGNVVLSERVVAYERKAVETSRDIYRPDMDRPPHTILQDVAAYLSSSTRNLRYETLSKNLVLPVPRKRSKTQFAKHVAGSLEARDGTIASGEELLRNPARLIWYRENIHGRIEVGEMEAAGLASVCSRAGLPWLVVRGISDFGDDFKDDQFHDYASMAAAGVAADFLKHGLSLESLPSHREKPQRREIEKPIPTPVPHHASADGSIVDPRLREFSISVVSNILDVLDAENWTLWLAGISDVFPQLSLKRLEALGVAGTFLMTRAWPSGVERMRDVCENLRRVINDFLETFWVHAETINERVARIPQFYRISEWNHDRYVKLNKEWQFHIDLIGDLALELTRALNLVLDRTRDFVDPYYRLDLGRVAMLGSPNLDFGRDSLLPLYDDEQGKQGIPYSNLDAFLTARANRDFFFGVGKSSTDDAFLEHLAARRRKDLDDDP